MLPLLLLLFLFLLPFPVSAQTQTINIGILGDSGSDEYRANDNRGGSYAATTLNWVEQLERYRNFNLGSWGTRSEPRRSGYEYNWARSGASTITLITSGEHTGLAAQLNPNNISTVIMMIGANDFAVYYGDDGNTTIGYDAIYNGSLSGSALTSRLNRIVSHILQAMDTIKAAKNVNFLWATVPDQNINPQIVASYPNAAGRQRVSDAIAYVNNSVKSQLGTRNIKVFDILNFYSQMFAQRGAGGTNLRVGSEIINLATSGDEPHNGILADRIHGGTVMNGLLANGYIDALNNNFNLGIPPLTDTEILSAAGLASPCLLDLNGDQVQNLLDFNRSNLGALLANHGKRC